MYSVELNTISTQSSAMSKQSAVKIPEVKYPVFYPHMRDASSAKSRPCWWSIYFYVYALENTVNTSSQLENSVRYHFQVVFTSG